VNAYRDAKMGVGPSVTRISAPSWGMNCYGYATGLGYWVQGPISTGGPTPSSGIDYVLRYDWDPCSVPSDIKPGNVQIFSSDDHAVRIDQVIENSGYRIIIATREKWAYAGTYLKTYSLPDGANFYIGGMLKPKP